MEGFLAMTTDLITKLFLVHSVIRRAINTSFKQAGLAWNFEHFIFLTSIPASKGIPLKYIATTVFGRDQSAMRRALSALERGRLIRLKREAEDRRHLRVHITSEGIEVLASLNRLAHDSMDTALFSDEQETLVKLSGMLDQLQPHMDYESSQVA